MNARRWLAFLVPVLIAGHCPWHPNPPATCWCVPDVASVEIVPSRFTVRPGSTFEMTARLRDAAGNEIPEFFSYRPQWTVLPAGNGVNIRSALGHTVVLEVPSTFTDADDFQIIAEAVPGIASSEATGDVVATPPTADYVSAADHNADQPLAMALGGTGAPDAWATSVAFAGTGNLGSLNAIGGLMVFTADHAMAWVAAVDWTGGDQFVRYQAGPGGRAQQDPQQPLVKNITIWIDPNAGGDQWPITTAEAVARIHADDASRTFLRNRVGVRFSITVNRIIGGTLDHRYDPCGPWDVVNPVMGAPTGGGTSVPFNAGGSPNSVDVFIVDLDIDTGFTCEDASAPAGYRMFLNATYTLPNVLAHELGHILLKMDNDQDHADGIAIRATNLMVQGDDPTAPRRAHLSLGQACLMNLSRVVSPLRGGALQTPLSCPIITTDVP